MSAAEGLQLHPLFNALLNATSAVLLMAAYVSIRAGERERHKKLMLSAFAVSTVFLVSYLIRFYLADGPAKFPGAGLWKVIYLVILFSHMVLAATVPLGVVLAIRWGLKGQFAKHRRLTKWMFPTWLYVSVTGVVIYAMLYHWPR